LKEKRAASKINKEKRKERDKRYYDKNKREVRSKTKQPRGVSTMLDIDDLVGV